MMRKIAIDISAVVIAAGALIVSLLSYFQAQSGLKTASESNQLSSKSLQAVLIHNEKSLRPKLAFRYKLSIGASDPGFFKLKNVGQGPAELVSIKASYQGADIETDAATLSMLGAKSGLVGFNLVVGEVIAPGESASIFDIPAKKYSKGQICSMDKRRKSFFENLFLQITYRSLYEHEDMVVLKYKSPNNFSC